VPGSLTEAAHNLKRSTARGKSPGGRNWSSRDGWKYRRKLQGWGVVSCRLKGSLPTVWPWGGSYLDGTLEAKIRGYWREFPPAGVGGWIWEHDDLHQHKDAIETSSKNAEPRGGVNKSVGEGGRALVKKASFGPGFLIKGSVVRLECHQTVEKFPLEMIHV